MKLTRRECGQFEVTRVMKSALLFALLVPALVLADIPVRCIDGQYVVTVRKVRALRKKALEELESVSDVPLDIAKEDKHVMLLSEDGASNHEIVSGEENRSNPCAKLRSKNREKLRRHRSGERKEVLRRYSCSCNALLSASVTPNDTYFSLQKGFHQPSNGIDIKMPAAWDMAKGSPGVIVAIIDTGVDYTHSDLAANMWTNPQEVPGNGIDDDGDGYIDDVRGYNAIDGSGNPMDDNGHGTHVAGVIGARTNNGSGISGINWNIRMVPVKFLGANGQGTLYDAIKAVDYVTALRARGYDVIASNNSWSGGGYIQPLYDAIARSRDADILFVAAAGNNSQNLDVSPAYPASYQISNIVSVAAVDENGNIASFSNYGQSVHIGAPGVTIASTYPAERYVYLSGTSMAAPHVTGAAALLKSYSAAMTAAQLKASILANGTTLNSLSGVVGTSKYLNVYVMVVNAAPLPYNPDGSAPVVSPTATPTPSPTPTATVTPTPAPTPQPSPGYYSMTGSVTVNGAPLASVRVSLSTTEGEFVKYTGPSGTFTFSGIYCPTQYELKAEKNGYSFSSQSGSFMGNVTLNLTAQINPHVITVNVIDPQKRPIAGITVNAGAFGSATTDAHGIATLSIPYGSDYTLSATAAGYSFSQSFIPGRVLGSATRVFVAVKD